MRSLSGLKEKMGHRISCSCHNGLWHKYNISPIGAMGLIGLITRSGKKARERRLYTYQLGGTLLGEGHGIQRLARGLSTRSDYTLLEAVGSSGDKYP